jgi:hypothetical protein
VAGLEDALTIYTEAFGNRAAAQAPIFETSAGAHQFVVK